MSKIFNTGDKVKFSHWLMDATIVGMVLDSYRVMGETYLVVKTETGETFNPSESRCHLEKV